MKILLFAVFGLTSLAARAQETGRQPAAGPEHPFSVGVLGTYQAAGVQADYRFAKSYGVKLVGARQFSYERAGEYGLAGIGLVTYYFSTSSKLVEPLVGLGGIYSTYHWALAGRSGTVRDWNVGGGFGLNLRFSDRLKTGLYVFLANGFRADYQPALGDMAVTGRRLVVFPALTLDVRL